MRKELFRQFGNELKANRLVFLDAPKPQPAGPEQAGPTMAFTIEDIQATAGMTPDQITAYYAKKEAEKALAKDKTPDKKEEGVYVPKLTFEAETAAKKGRDIIDEDDKRDAEYRATGGGIGAIKRFVARLTGRKDNEVASK